LRVVLRGVVFFRRISESCKAINNIHLSFHR
jgi:hypothetical protein